MSQLTLGPSSRFSMVPEGGLSTGRLMDFGATDVEPNLLLPENILTSQELDPLIVLYFGRRGDGKTLCMTSTLNIMLRAYIKNGKRFSKRHPDGFKLATNYHVQFADFNDPHIVDMVSSYDDRMRRMVIGIDEILSYVPSRRSMARSNVDFANFLVQIRKLDIELLSTTQRPQNIDSQMLDQIDLFIMPVLFNKRWIPELQRWTHKKTGKMIYRPTSVRLLVWDWWGTYTGKQYSKRWPPQISGEPSDYTLDFHGIHELFSWFSTKEQIPAIWHANREDVIHRDWAQALEDMRAGLAPDIVEQEADGIEPATLTELINAQPDEVYLAQLLEQSKKLDRSVRSIGNLVSKFEAQGYTVIKEGRYGYHAFRLGDG
jgi:hypothetical protein